MSGSDTAKSGFKAEEIFRTRLDINNALTIYFDKPLKVIVKAKHGAKYDNEIIFNDGTRIKVQNKKFKELGGRGDSFDRRHISKTFNNQLIIDNLTLLSLIKPQNMSDEKKDEFQTLCTNNFEDITQYLKKTLIGENLNKNDIWVFMEADGEFSNIKLYIIDSDKLYTFIEKSINISVKKTCLHISPYIYLQRKGGDKKDHSPNDIQAKLKITKELLDICTQIL
jgi:hypothetical protein